MLSDDKCTLVMQFWPNVISWHNLFCGIGGGGWVSVQGAMHMAAALASYRKALVGTGLGSFLTQMGVDKAPLLCRGSICGTGGSF